MFNPLFYKDMFKPDEILLYLRKSRTDDPTFSVEEVLQKHETILNEWIANNLDGMIPEENRYREVVSGESIEDRIEFQKLLKMVESPKIKAVLVVELQRLGRPDLEEIGKITKIFRYTGITVITPVRAYNLQDEYDRDSFERELKRGNEYLEYQKKIMGRGRQLSVSQGNYIGSVPPYGYNKIWVAEDKKKYPTLEENKEQADIVRMIFDLYVNKDMGVFLIGKYLDDLHIQPPKGKYWSPHGIKDMLQNIHYIGKVTWNKRKVVTVVKDGGIVKTRPDAKKGDYFIYEGKHSAIISEEIFQQAQEKIGRNYRAKPDTKLRNPLAGLLYCKCGRAMSMRVYKKKGVEKAPTRLVCDDQVHCGTGSCLYDEMIERLGQILERCIADFEVKLEENNQDAVKLHNNIIKNLEKKLADLEEKEVLQWDAQYDPNPDKRIPPDMFAKLKAKNLKEKEELRQALAQAYESMPVAVDYENEISKFRNALNALRDDDFSAEDKNKLLKACIKKIVYHREKPERIKSQKEHYYDPLEKKTKSKSSLPTGGNWTTPPIEIDIELAIMPTLKPRV